MTTPPRSVAGSPPEGRPGAALPALPSVAATTDSSLAVQVMTAVRRAITAGEMEPGRLYSVQQLASAMDVSRSPVREGLLRLGEAGLIRFHRNRGFEIVEVSPADVAEIFAVRTALEVPAARRAARLAGPEELDRIRAQWRTMHDAARAGDLEATTRADEGLHRLLLLVADNSQVLRLVERLRTTTAFLGVVAATSRRPVDELAREHDTLVQAVLARDEEAAGRAMREHLTSTARRLVAQALLARRTPAERVEELTAQVWDAATAGY
ncbi:GntR family transcriptional regulator [Kocuria sp. M4R2S49]|uniref:GntR family transcriptional regulator n=1 Tax=Kocuria rhizosphaericola TaxID=3376284 RepID=UPI0037A22E24